MLQVQKEIHEMILKHQQLPGSILPALRARWKPTKLCWKMHLNWWNQSYICLVLKFTVSSDIWRPLIFAVEFFNVLSFFTQCCNHKGVFFAFHWFYIPMPSTKGLFILFNLANIGSYFKQVYASQTSAKKCHILCKNRGDVVKLFKNIQVFSPLVFMIQMPLGFAFWHNLGFLQKQSSTIDTKCQK